MQRGLRLISILLFFVACTSPDKLPAVEKTLSKPARDNAWERAATDFKKDSLKYYYFGIAQAPVKLSIHLRESFHITVVNNIEIPNPDDIYYNQFTDSVLVNKAGKSFEKLYLEFY